ncbi:hypothetical protein KY285_029796 [Solanum tuberosum]|nr:hypothetical protein KY285_029796 [Solanum tuberosum]
MSSLNGYAHLTSLNLLYWNLHQNSVTAKCMFRQTSTHKGCSVWSSDLLGPGENLSLQSSRGTKGHASGLLEQSCNPETFIGYSRNIVHCVAGSAKEAWVGVHRATGSWAEVVQWMSNWAKKKFGTGAILSCIFPMLVATIWRDRNRIRFQGGSYNADRICREIAIHIHIRGTELKHC